MKKEEEGNKKNSIGIDPEKYFFPVGNYRLRRAERWEYIPTVSSEVGEIYGRFIYKALRVAGGSTRYARSQGRME